MSPTEVVGVLERGREAGCTEALFCLGDRPELISPAYRQLLADWGFDSTVSYLVEAAGWALEHGFLPHTNAGVLSHSELARLKAVNVSLGLMLESTSPRLSAPGGVHHQAPDKRPAVRIRMTRDAGALKIPFTSGLLLGIGETLADRVETLLTIRDLHREGGARAGGDHPELQGPCRQCHAAGPRAGTR